MDDGLDTVNGRASGDYVKMVYNYERHHPSRMLEKLTDRHFNYDCFDKMRVSLAVQIMSESVALAIEKMLSVDYFENRTDAIATMKFCRNMNVLFDLLNAKDPNDTNKNKRGVTAQNISLLKELSTYLETVSKPTKNKVYWIEGMRQTVNCVIGLYEEHFAAKPYSLLTRHLNQDPLENLFGQIRSQVVNSQNPYMIDFLRILSRLITSKIDISLKNANCEFDFSSEIKLIDMKTVKKEEKQNTDDKSDCWIDCDDDEVQFLSMFSS